MRISASAFGKVLFLTPARPGALWRLGCGPSNKIALVELLFKLELKMETLNRMKPLKLACCLLVGLLSVQTLVQRNAGATCHSEPAGREQPPSANRQFKLDDLVNIGKVHGKLQELVRNIQLAWKSESGKKNVDPLALVLGELGKFKERLIEERTRLREQLMSYKQAEEEAKRAAAGGHRDGPLVAAGRSSEDARGRSPDGPHEAGRVGDLIARSAAAAAAAQTEVDHEGLEEARIRRLESIRSKTGAYVKTLFVDEAKSLAMLLLQESINGAPVDFTQGSAKTLLGSLKLNLLRYVFDVLVDLLMLLYEQKDRFKGLPPTATPTATPTKRTKGEEENLGIWLLQNMID